MNLHGFTDDYTGEDLITTLAAHLAPTADLEELTVSSEPTRALPRRAVLAVSGTAVLAAAAACSSGGTTAASTPSATAGPSAKAGSSPAPTTLSSAAPPTTSSSASSAEAAPTTNDAAPGGTPVASVADVQAAGSVVVQADSGPLLLAFAGGTVVAHTAVCTHQQCTIAASGMCPCHGSRFNVTTGAVENGPALRPLAQENVTVSDGRVYLA